MNPKSSNPPLIPEMQKLSVKKLIVYVIVEWDYVQVFQNEVFRDKLMADIRAAELMKIAEMRGYKNPDYRAIECEVQ